MVMSGEAYLQDTLRDNDGAHLLAKKEAGQLGDECRSPCVWMRVSLMKLVVMERLAGEVGHWLARGS